MIESFALLTANVQVKLDDEFPELTDALLSVLYPHYLAPLPSMAIVQLALNPGSADAPTALRAAAFADGAPPVEGVACRFRTGYDIKLWPLEVTEAKLREPPYPPGLEPPAELRRKFARYLRVTDPMHRQLAARAAVARTLRLFILGEAQLTVDSTKCCSPNCKHVVILPENRRCRRRG